MGRYTIRRLLQFIPVLLGTTFLIFAMVYAVPSNPAQALAGERGADPAVIAKLNQEFHLDDPLVVQYGYYMAGLFTGDLGESFRGREVNSIIAETVPVTFRLALVALLIESIIGIIAGVLAALRRGSYIDNLVLVSTLFVVSIPVFVVGFLLQFVLGYKLDIVAVAGLRQGWVSYIVPGYVLASTSLAYVARLTRTTLAENMRADYVRTATAKGLGRRRVVGLHALRNSLIPVVTFLGADLGNLMGGAIITERVFQIPGVGGEVADAVLIGETPVVVGIVTVLVVFYLVANLVVDLLYAVLDPRIRYE